MKQPVHISGVIQGVLLDIWQKRRPIGKAHKGKMFNPNSKSFRKDYDSLYKKEPVMANMYLLLCELADRKGQVVIDEWEISELMEARFNDPGEYALGGAKNE
jgi:hypothetical protein